MLYVLKYAFKESLWITTETSVAYLTTELTIGKKKKKPSGSRGLACINHKYVNKTMLIVIDSDLWVLISRILSLWYNLILSFFVYYFIQEIKV